MSHPVAYTTLTATGPEVQAEAAGIGTPRVKLELGNARKQIDSLSIYLRCSSKNEHAIPPLASTT